RHDEEIRLLQGLVVGAAQAPGDVLFFFTSRSRHTIWPRDWSSDVCSSDLSVRQSPDSWRARPLVSYRVIVELISATTTKTGLTVRCELDTGLYPSGIVVSDAEIAALNIKRAEFHGEWNYTISPNTYPPNCAFIS